MFKRTLLSLITLASLSAAEESMDPSSYAEASDSAPCFPLRQGFGGQVAQGFGGHGKATSDKTAAWAIARGDGSTDMAAPTVETEMLAAQTDEAEPAVIRQTAQSIRHLQKGILIMERDTNKECEEFMRNIAANARMLLTKLMALASMSKLGEYEEDLKAELIHELYRTYKHFNAKLEATYNQAAAPIDTPTEDTSASKESPIT